MSNVDTPAYVRAAVAEVPEPETTPLTAPLRNSFAYTRSLGPVLGRFADGIRAGKIIGGRASDGRVMVPPSEFDPATGAATDDFVEVGPVGTVTSWAWQPEPLRGQPLSEPFAYALIRFDGADTDMLHAVAVPTKDDIAVGTRVVPVWATERTGRILDITHFVPGEQATDAPASTGEQEIPGVVVEPVALEIEHAATVVESLYLDALKNGKLLGGRTSDGVYFPPRVASPATGEPTTEMVELTGKGTVTTFCIVNVPFMGQQIKPPYVAAYVLLDGADIGFLHLILDCEASDVRMGMRVEAVWRDEAEWGHTARNISHFRPTGEPDADYETYRSYL